MVKIWKLLRAENGQATVLVAAALIALLGFTALAVDMGNVYLEKSRLQKALDAAVLGGAQVLMMETEAAAEAEAAGISTKNGFSLNVDTDVEASSVNHYVKATKQKEVGMLFAKVLGKTTMTIEANAKANIGKIIGMKGLVPIGIDDGDVPNFNEKITLAFPPGSDLPAPGNFGFLDLDGHHDGGTNELENRILNGYDEKVSVGSLIYTETGAATDPYIALKTRENQIVYIPIIEQWVSGQKDPVKVVGFAAFKLEKLDEIDDSLSPGKGKTIKKITGTFIKNITQGELDEEFKDVDFGLYGVKLTE
jgi:Flp pilus assembly protein TadG